MRFCIAAASLMMLLGSCHPGLRAPSSKRQIRSIWVTRWDYKTASDIAQIMENCGRSGFNTVLFQVRGNGTALYRSRIEPWADELGGRDPGFDPLAVACREAHRRGLELHAWANVMPGWHGPKPPANPNQLYHKRPEWFWRDARGRRQPLGWYQSLNPCYPEVRQYLVAVMKEIVQGYPVDGLHMDYIRFPNEWNDSYPPGTAVPDYPRDPRTLAMFQRATGKTPQQAPQAWIDWRTAAVTQLVRDIRKTVRAVKPNVKLSAAVGPTPQDSRQRHFQDSSRWIKEGLLDAVYPMNYAADQAMYNARLAEWTSARLPIPVVPGIMFDRRDPATVLPQMNRAIGTASHFSAFAYNSLFERSDAAGRPQTDAASAGRATLRRQVIPRIQQLGRHALITAGR